MHPKLNDFDLIVTNSFDGNKFDLFSTCIYYAYECQEKQTDDIKEHNTCLFINGENDGIISSLLHSTIQIVAISVFK